MLLITIPAMDLWDERKQEFVSRKEQTLQLEHSLVSLSKWESKWCKAFLGKTEKSEEEIIDYIRCMTITQNVDPETYHYLTNDNWQQINDYINSPATATVFSQDKNHPHNRETVTAELIYYWMVSLGIDFKCEKWHLNRLLTLIRVCNIKNQSPKKRSKRDIMAQNTALNAARRQQLNSRG